MRYLNRGWYQGDVNHRNRPHGKGILRYDNGNVYEGNFAEGIKKGRGVYLREDTHYEGEHAFNMAQGFGVFTQTNFNQKYFGYFMKDEMDSEGLNHTDGNMSNFYDFDPERKGICRMYFEGNYLESQYSKNQPCGQGRIVFEGEIILECFFENGNHCGPGIMRFPDGSVLHATYVDNDRFGKASFLWANGDVFEGEFINHNEAIGTKTILETGEKITGEFTGPQIKLKSHDEKDSIEPKKKKIKITTDVLF